MRREILGILFPLHLSPWRQEVMRVVRQENHVRNELDR